MCVHMPTCISLSSPLFSLSLYTCVYTHTYTHKVYICSLPYIYTLPQYLFLCLPVIKKR